MIRSFSWATLLKSGKGIHSHPANAYGYKPPSASSKDALSQHSFSQIIISMASSEQLTWYQRSDHIKQPFICQKQKLTTCGSSQSTTFIKHIILSSRQNIQLVLHFPQNHMNRFSVRPYCIDIFGYGLHSSLPTHFDLVCRSFSL